MRCSLPRLALFALLSTALGGCYAAHERTDPSGDRSGATTPPASTVDDGFRTSTVSRAAPSAPGCGPSQWAPLAPAGLDDLRRPAIAAIDGGFVASIVHASSFDYPTAVFRMRGDLTGSLDAPMDAGVISNEGGTIGRPAMVAGGDGRIASCVVTSTTEDYRFLPGGVAFFDARGRLERIERFGFECADVAWVDGRWVAFEITGDEPPAPTANLVVFGADLAVAERIALDATDLVPSGAARIASLHERAVIVGPGQHGERIVSVDLDTRDMRAATLRAVSPVSLTASQFAAVDLGDVLGLAWVDENGSVWWSTFDDALEGTTAAPLGAAASYVSFVEARPIAGGAVVAFGAVTSLEVVLVNEAGATAVVDAAWPARDGDEIDTLAIAVQDDLVAVALEVDNPGLAATPDAIINGIWSARCRVE